MMISMFKRFCATRRSAIAVTMAVTLVPLVLLIGIAIDVTFLSQARTQATFASQSAAVAATRVAGATYSLEVANNPTESLQTAAKQAIATANEQGNQWFASDLGSYSRGSLLNVSTNTLYDGKTDGTPDSTKPPSFSATVSDSSTYPPIFNPLFGRNTPWVSGSSGTASTQYSYAEILLLLDTSQSMMIGADPTDILKLEDNSACPQYNQIQATDAGGVIAGEYLINSGELPTGFDTSGLVQYNGNGGCNSLNGQPYGISPSYLSGVSGNAAETPCALACHFSTKVTGGYTDDLYGLARRHSVTLRIDVLFEATEEVLQDMINSQANALGQLAVGVYQFNTDIGAIVNSTTGTGGQTPEATTDLNAALTAVNAIDPSTHPINNPIPQLTNYATVFKSDLSQAVDGNTTDLVLAMKDFLAGNAFPKSSSNALQPLGASGSGNTAATPVKYVFLVTDGMEDESLLNGGRAFGTLDDAGDMTSVKGEATTGTQANTGTCSALKKAGFTVYVLYVEYYPLQDNLYTDSLATIGRTPTPETVVDYPTETAANTTQDLTNEPSNAMSPTALALQACASAPADFQAASDSQSIQTALQSMLKQALASSIRLTN